MNIYSHIIYMFVIISLIAYNFFVSNTFIYNNYNSMSMSNVNNMANMNKTNKTNKTNEKSIIQRVIFK